MGDTQEWPPKRGNYVLITDQKIKIIVIVT